MRTSLRAAFVLFALILSSPARADRRELYTVLGYDPGVTRYDLGRRDSGGTTRPSGTLTVTGYYGFTNTWHVGARLRVSSKTNLHVDNAVVVLNDTKTVGDIYEDHLGLGLDGVILYRVETHYPLAPLIELEGGFTSHQFRRVVFIPKGSTYSYSQSSVSSVVLHGAAALLLEYRFSTRWVAAAGFSAERETGDVPWSYSVPLRVGFIW